MKHAALNKKLWRDLRRIKGQLTAIALVMAAGIALFILSFGVLDSIKLTRSVYYENQGFADVFVQLKRAPEHLRERLSELPGVQAVETRVVFGATVELDGLNALISAQLLSLPEHRAARLNRVYLKSGRALLPGEQGAVLVNHAFMQANGLHLGDAVVLTFNGHRHRMRLVGSVLSPEFVYTLKPGSFFPDDSRYGVFWMNRSVLAAATQMTGAFNDASLKLAHGADLEAVKSAVDRILAPYGGLLSYDRSLQVSSWFVENEIRELQTMAWFSPVIFLGVAVFLIHVVLSRLVATQREQIGMLKAVGFLDREIIAHFMRMVWVMLSVGALIGVLLGLWLGTGLTEMYTRFFHFPVLRFAFSLRAIVFSVCMCAAVAVLGAVSAVKRIMALAPAEAMRPAAPAVYHKTLFDRSGVYAMFSHSTRIVVRQLSARPLRSGFSVLGVALATAILLFSFFIGDSINYMLSVQFDRAQRQDTQLTFVDNQPLTSLQQIRRLPGVLTAEPLRSVAVRLSYGHRSKRTSILGLHPAPDLHRILDTQLQPVAVPPGGLALSTKLAELLRVQVGDVLTVEVLQDKRQVVRVPVVALAEELIGLSAFMHIERLNALLDQAPGMSAVALLTDPAHNEAFNRAVRGVPAIADVTRMNRAREVFTRLMDENFVLMTLVNVLFAGLIAFGVVYNIARIAVAERGRELATLRVLGFSRLQVAFILFGELGLVTLLAIPIGFVLGLGMIHGMTLSMDNELFRFPVVVLAATYGTAALAVIASAVISFYLVWKKVTGISLVSAHEGIE